MMFEKLSAEKVSETSLQGFWKERARAKEKRE